MKSYNQFMKNSKLQTRTTHAEEDFAECDRTGSFSKLEMQQDSIVMSSVICTLFEGSYHYGLAVLVNSLYSQGFQGEVYAGYKGLLPLWTRKAVHNNYLSWQGATTLMVNDNIKIHFLPLQTDNHLTNYKPDFMLELWEGPAKGAAQLFYFDPDIVVDTRWNFFSQWVEYGVAVCEDVNSPLPANHPRRKAWREFFLKHGISLKFKEDYYANGGFVGLALENKDFLKMWKLIQEKMGNEIGGLGVSQFDSTSSKTTLFSEPQYHFSKTDQDALNAAIEAWNGDISFVGKEGMGFKSGSALLPHAIGGSKPWSRNALKMALLGSPPRPIDHCYWKHAKGPIALYSSVYHFRKQTAQKIAALIGRFYRKS